MIYELVSFERFRRRGKYLVNYRVVATGYPFTSQKQTPGELCLFIGAVVFEHHCYRDAAGDKVKSKTRHIKWRRVLMHDWCQNEGKVGCGLSFILDRWEIEARKGGKGR